MLMYLLYRYALDYSGNAGNREGGAWGGGFWSPALDGQLPGLAGRGDGDFGSPLLSGFLT